MDLIMNYNFKNGDNKLKMENSSSTNKGSLNIESNCEVNSHYENENSLNFNYPNHFESNFKQLDRLDNSNFTSRDRIENPNFKHLNHSDNPSKNEHNNVSTTDTSNQCTSFAPVFIESDSYFSCINHSNNRNIDYITFNKNKDNSNYSNLTYQNSPGIFAIHKNKDNSEYSNLTLPNSPDSITTNNKYIVSTESSLSIASYDFLRASNSENSNMPRNLNVYGSNSHESNILGTLNSYRSELIITRSEYIPLFQRRNTENRYLNESIYQLSHIRDDNNNINNNNINNSINKTSNVSPITSNPLFNPQISINKNYSYSLNVISRDDFKNILNYKQKSDSNHIHLLNDCQEKYINSSTLVKYFQEPFNESFLFPTSTVDNTPNSNLALSFAIISSESTHLLTKLINSSCTNYIQSPLTNENKTASQFLLSLNSLVINSSSANFVLNSSGIDNFVLNNSSITRCVPNNSSITNCIQNNIPIYPVPSSNLIDSSILEKTSCCCSQKYYSTIDKRTSLLVVPDLKDLNEIIAENTSPSFTNSFSFVADQFRTDKNSIITRSNEETCDETKSRSSERVLRKRKTSLKQVEPIKKLKFQLSIEEKEFDSKMKEGEEEEHDYKLTKIDRQALLKEYNLKLSTDMNSDGGVNCLKLKSICESMKGENKVENLKLSKQSLFNSVSLSNTNNYFNERSLFFFPPTKEAVASIWKSPIKKHLQPDNYWFPSGNRTTIDNLHQQDKHFQANSPGLETLSTLPTKDNRTINSNIIGQDIAILSSSSEITTYSESSANENRNQSTVDICVPFVTKAKKVPITLLSGSINGLNNGGFGEVIKCSGCLQDCPKNKASLEHGYGNIKDNCGLIGCASLSKNNCSSENSKINCKTNHYCECLSCIISGNKCLSTDSSPLFSPFVQKNVDIFTFKPICQHRDEQEQQANTTTPYRARRNTLSYYRNGNEFSSWKENNTSATSLKRKLAQIMRDKVTSYNNKRMMSFEDRNNELISDGEEDEEYEKKGLDLIIQRNEENYLHIDAKDKLGLLRSKNEREVSIGVEQEDYQNRIVDIVESKKAINEHQYFGDGFKIESFNERADCLLLGDITTILSTGNATIEYEIQEILSNEIDTTNKTNKTDQINTTDQIDTFNEIDTSDQIDKTNQIGTTDQINRIDQIDTTDQIDKTDKIIELNKLSKRRNDERKSLEFRLGKKSITKCSEALETGNNEYDFKNNTSKTHKNVMFTSVDTSIITSAGLETIKFQTTTPFKFKLNNSLTATSFELEAIKIPKASSKDVQTNTKSTTPFIEHLLNEECNEKIDMERISFDENNNQIT